MANATSPIWFLKNKIKWNKTIIPVILFKLNTTFCLPTLSIDSWKQDLRLILIIQTEIKRTLQGDLRESCLTLIPSQLQVLKWQYRHWSSSCPKKASSGEKKKVHGGGRWPPSAFRFTMCSETLKMSPRMRPSPLQARFTNRRHKPEPYCRGLAGFHLPTEDPGPGSPRSPSSNCHSHTRFTDQSDVQTPGARGQA